MGGRACSHPVQSKTSLYHDCHSRVIEKQWKRSSRLLRVSTHKPRYALRVWLTSSQFPGLPQQLLHSGPHWEQTKWMLSVLWPPCHEQESKWDVGGLRAGPGHKVTGAQAQGMENSKKRCAGQLHSKFPESAQRAATCQLCQQGTRPGEGTQLRTSTDPGTKERDHRGGSVSTACSTIGARVTAQGSRSKTIHEGYRDAMCALRPVSAWGEVGNDAFSILHF